MKDGFVSSVRVVEVVGKLRSRKIMLGFVFRSLLVDFEERFWRKDRGRN